MKPTMIKGSTGPKEQRTRSILTGRPMLKVALILLLTITFTAHAGDPPVFEITWFTIDGGGGTSQGDQYTVSGTIGQPDADVMTGGGFELSGGFWSASTVVPLSGDCEHDGDVDLDDYACFLACVLGPGQGLLPDCGPFDLDNDGDVDIADYSNFAPQFNGPS